MYTKILTLASLFMFSRYDVGGGCVANYAQDAADMKDPGSGLQVTPGRISISAGGTLRVDAGLARAGQGVQLKQGSLELALGTLDAEGSLQKQVTKADLAGFSLGAAQVVTTSGAQAMVRFFIEPRFDNAPALYPVGRVMKTDPTPVWIGVAQKKILTLNFRDASGTGLIRQSIGEYIVDIGGLLIIPQMQIYKNYSSPVFPGNYSDQGSKFQYISTGIGMTLRSLFLSEYDATGPQAIFLDCPLDAGCSGTLTVRPFTRVTSVSAANGGSLFAAIVTTAGSPAMLRAFRDGTLGTAVDIVGGSTGLPHETMLGVGRLNEDDFADLVAVSPTGAVSVWLGGPSQLTASDAMAAAVQQALAGAAVATPSALAVGDLDGDGLDDVVAASNAQVALLINQGEPGGGRFSSLTGPTVPAGLAPVTAAAIGDVSVGSGGIPDLVLASKDQHSIGAIENSATR